MRASATGSDKVSTALSQAVGRELSIRRVPLASLHLDPANARSHPERNLDAIKSSLARFGQVEPLVVLKGSQRVIGGNGRLVAMRSLGWSECDIVELDITELDATALGIALNRTADLAEWDQQALSSILQALQSEGALDGVGFDEREIQSIIDDAASARESLDGLAQDAAMDFQKARDGTITYREFTNGQVTKEIGRGGELLPDAYRAPQPRPRSAHRREAFRPLLDDSAAARDVLGIVGVEVDVTTPGSVGAMQVAALLARQGDAIFLADIAGILREFVRLCGGGHEPATRGAFGRPNGLEDDRLFPNQDFMPAGGFVPAVRSLAVEHRRPASPIFKDSRSIASGVPAAAWKQTASAVDRPSEPTAPAPSTWTEMGSAALVWRCSEGPR